MGKKRALLVVNKSKFAHLLSALARPGEEEEGEDVEFWVTEPKSTVVDCLAESNGLGAAACAAAGGIRGTSLPTPPQDYDLILQKGTEALARWMHSPRPRLRRPNAFTKAGKGLVVGTYSQLLPILDRSLLHSEHVAMTKGLPPFLFKDRRLRLVRSVTVDVSAARASWSEIVKGAGLTFPIVLKPSLACGSAESHRLGVALNAAGIEEYARLGGQLRSEACAGDSGHDGKDSVGRCTWSWRSTIVLQEYVNHAASLRKVTLPALGTGAESEIISSLPDLCKSTLAGLEGEKAPALVVFDSQDKEYATKVTRALEELCPGVLTAGGDELATAPSWSSSSFSSTALAETVHTFLVTRCFSPASRAVARFCGVDLVEEKSTGDLVIVDVNFMPSCSRVQAAALRDGMCAAVQLTGVTKTLK